MHMHLHMQIGEHPNSAFTRVSQRSQTNFNELSTSQALPQIVPKRLSTSQIAFRKIKNLFCTCRDNETSKKQN